MLLNLVILVVKCTSSKEVSFFSFSFSFFSFSFFSFSFLTFSLGVCTVMNASENIIYAVFTSGAFFGEFALLFSQRRTATIKVFLFPFILFTNFDNRISRN